MDGFNMALEIQPNVVHLDLFYYSEIHMAICNKFKCNYSYTFQKNAIIK